MRDITIILNELNDYPLSALQDVQKQMRASLLKGNRVFGSYDHDEKVLVFINQKINGLLTQPSADGQAEKSLTQEAHALARQHGVPVASAERYLKRQQQAQANVRTYNETYSVQHTIDREQVATLAAQHGVSFSTAEAYMRRHSKPAPEPVPPLVEQKRGKEEPWHYALERKANVLKNTGENSNG